MRRALAPLAFLLLVACGAMDSSSPEEMSLDRQDAPASGPSGMLGGEMDASKESKAIDSRTTARKLIRTGRIRIAVDDYAAFQGSLDARLAALGGFVADQDLNHAAGKVSWATLVVRVPADDFDALLRWTESKVEIQALNIDTADVTEQWTDVRARIANGERTEARLLGLLDSGTGDLEDVLAVERELSRVRGEIESAEGRMRVLGDQVSLATLTIDVAVRALYTPPVEAGYLARLGTAVTASVTALVEVAEGVSILAIAALPWLVLLGLLGLGLRGVYRLLRRPAAV